MSTRIIPVLSLTGVFIFVLVFAWVVAAEPSTQQRDDEGGDSVSNTATPTSVPTATATSSWCWRPGPQCTYPTNTPRPATATAVPPTNTPRPTKPPPTQRPTCPRTADHDCSPTPTATTRPTAVPPTATAVPPTATAVPLTATAIPPTPTPIPPIPTPTPIAPVGISPPTLSASVSYSSVTLSWDLVTGSTDYEIEYRQGEGAWITSTVSPRAGQSHINVIAGNDYDFRIRTASAGQNASATWGYWSGPYSVFTGQAPQPVLSTVRIWDRLVIVSWPEIEGTVGSSAVARPVSSSSSNSRESDITGTSIDTYRLENLQPETEYDIMAKVRSDGSKYVLGWSVWSNPLRVTTLAPYLNAIVKKPDGASPCGDTYPLRRASSLDTRYFGDNTYHTIRSGIWVGSHLGPAPLGELPPILAYCVEGRVFNDSRPGAEESYWRGDMYTGELAILELEVNAASFAAAISARSLSPLARFFQRTTPDRRVPAEYPTQYRCPDRCKGGEARTEIAYVIPKLLKHETFHIYGSHSIQSGEDSWEHPTMAEFQVDPKIYNSFFNLLGGVLGELIGDILEDVADEIRRLVNGE